jgi:hypothetical protein
MLRSRSKRPESWECGRSDLPISTSSSLARLQEHRFPESTRRRSSGIAHRSCRYLTPLILSIVILAIFYVCRANISVGQYRKPYFPFGTSKGNNPISTVRASSKSNNRTLPRGKPPLVDRSILDKLALLDQSADDPDELPPPSPQNKHAWPPVVTRIPEPTVSNTPSTIVHHQFQHEPISTAFPADFDFSICGADACRFILPLRIAEQESKARLHFLQILELAGSLNRIVVLPNVGKSRMGVCYRWNFDKYYDAEALRTRLDDGRIRVIDMETFRLWVATRPIKPNAQTISINFKPLASLSSSETLFFENGITVKVEQDQDPSDPRHIRCLNLKFPRLGLQAYLPLSIHPSKSLKSKPFGTRIVDALSREDVQISSFRDGDAAQVDIIDDGRPSLEEEENDQGEEQDYLGHLSDPEVLILNYDLRHPAFATSKISPPPLPYARNLTTLATNLLAPFEPADYLVIHWRMETVPPNILARCAHSLVRTLVGLLQAQDVEDDVTSNYKTVWFASDYPYPISRPLPSNTNRYQTQGDGGSKSGTFRGVGRQHEEAIEILRDAFDEGGALEGTKITGLAEELAKARAATAEDGKTGVAIEGELNDDSGILGILDKIVAMKAGLFVSGGKGCGRVRCVVLLLLSR